MVGRGGYFLLTESAPAAVDRSAKTGYNRQWKKALPVDGQPPLVKGSNRPTDARPGRLLSLCIHIRQNHTSKADENERVLKQVTICHHTDRPLSYGQGAKKVHPLIRGPTAADSAKAILTDVVEDCKQKAPSRSEMVLSSFIHSFAVSAQWKIIRTAPFRPGGTEKAALPCR